MASREWTGKERRPTSHGSSTAGDATRDFDLTDSRCRSGPRLLLRQSGAYRTHSPLEDQPLAGSVARRRRGPSRRRLWLCFRRGGGVAEADWAAYQELARLVQRRTGLVLGAPRQRLHVPCCFVHYQRRPRVVTVRVHKPALEEAAQLRTDLVRRTLFFLPFERPLPLGPSVIGRSRGGGRVWWRTPTPRAAGIVLGKLR